MSHFDIIATRSLLVQARRQSTRKGDQYSRVKFASLAEYTAIDVSVTRVTSNCIYFSDGNRIKRDSGRVINRTNEIVTYLPA
jgi:hypothetical protein